MNNIADITFINPHAKGIGSHHDGYFPVQESILVSAALFPGKPGMIHPGLYAILFQIKKQILHISPGCRIDNPGLSGMGFDIIQNIQAGVRRIFHAELQIGPIKAA